MTTRPRGLPGLRGVWFGAGDDARVFVICYNVARKHMKPRELDLALAELVTARKGGQPGQPSNNKKLNSDQDTNSTLVQSQSRKTRTIVAQAGGRNVHDIDGGGAEWYRATRGDIESIRRSLALI